MAPWWDAVSDDAKDLVSHALCLDPNDRYSIHEFMQHPWMLNQVNKRLSYKQNDQSIRDEVLDPSIDSICLFVCIFDFVGIQFWP
jgi:serine/threonine protein kinase